MLVKSINSGTRLLGLKASSASYKACDLEKVFNFSASQFPQLSDRDDGSNCLIRLLSKHAGTYYA